MKKKLFYGIMLIVGVVACNGNRLQINEKKLTQELLKYANSKDNNTLNLISNAKKGVKYKEIRNADPAHPPIVINIMDYRKAVSPIKTSSLFSKIEIIYISNNDTSKFPKQFIVGKKNIFSFSPFIGVQQYTHKGEFVKQVCTNSFPYATIGKRVSISLDDFNRQFIGALDVTYTDGQLYYQYANNTTGQYLIKKIDDKTESPSIQVNKQDAELKKWADEGIPKVDLGKSKSEDGQNQMTMASRSFNKLGDKKILVTTDNNIVVVNSKSPVGNTPLLTTLGANGDTLCNFADFDPVKNMEGETYRMPDEPLIYTVNNQMFIKPAFNDTIFQLIMPNKLAPKYVINLGSKGIRSATEAMNSKISLADKFLLESVLESSKYLFITYSQNYTCMKNIEDGTVKYSRLIYNKTNGKIIPVYMNQKLEMNDGEVVVPEINIINDLNDMPFFWPTGITANDEPFAVVNSDEIKSRLKPQQKASFSLTKKDVIILIYK